MQKITSIMLGVAVAASILIPSVTLAATTPADTFCTRLSGRETDLDKAMARREASVEKFQNDQLARIAKSRADQDNRMELRRTETDRDFAKRIEHLEARAKTQAQSDAVATYKNAITSAMTTRRAAVDAAFGTFRTGVDTAVAARQSGMDSALATFTTAIDAAITKAKADCTAHVAPSTVRKNFQNDLEAARSSFKTAKQNLPDLGAQIEALRVTRNQATEAARSAFKTSVAAARTALENAFK